MELPLELKTAIEEELAGGAPVRDAATGLSARYRSGKPDATGFIADEHDAAAYAAARMPATYAAAYAALKEAAACLPGFGPVTLLDAGAGTGAVAWAAVAVWPELREITLLERDGNMAALGRRLAARSPASALRNGRWTQADLTGKWETAQANLATLCYALGELPEDKQLHVVMRLWNAAQTLVIVEPGTKAGFERILRTRKALLDSGAHIAAPCPGGVPCPEAQGWCHFSARVARSRLHRQAKGAELAYEDEKYSYLVVTKAECSPCAARVLRHPKILKGYVELELCTLEGRRDITVSKRMGEDYRRARDFKWGDAASPFHNRKP
jgi:ribosomal protein RSM22 (predicted rRNA methylase)